MYKQCIKKKQYFGLSWWQVDKNPSANAGDTGSIPGLGRFYMLKATKPMSHNYRAHKLKLLKPMYLEPVHHKERRRHNEQPMHHNE